MGRVFAHHAFLACTQRNFTLAQQLVDQARVLLDATISLEDCAYCDLVEGGIAFYAEQWQRAIDFNNKAILLWQQAGNQEMIAQSRSNQGYAYQALGLFEQATACYEQAVIAFEQLQNPHRLAITYLNWGLLLHKQQAFQEALAMFSRCERLCLETGAKLNLAHSYNNQGDVYRALHCWQDAIDAYELALKTYQSIDEIEGEVNTLDNIAIVMLEQKRYIEVQNTLHRALSLLKTIPQDPDYENLLASLTRKLNHLNNIQEDPFQDPPA